MGHWKEIAKDLGEKEKFLENSLQECVTVTGTQWKMSHMAIQEARGTPPPPPHDLVSTAACVSSSLKSPLGHTRCLLPQLLKNYRLHKQPRFT